MPEDAGLSSTQLPRVQPESIIPLDEKLQFDLGSAGTRSSGMPLHSLQLRESPGRRLAPEVSTALSSCSYRASALTIHTVFSPFCPNFYP